MKTNKKIIIYVLSIVLIFLILFGVNQYLQSFGFMGYNRLFLAELIYAFTAIIIAWYTIETAEIRKLNQKIVEANKFAMEQLEKQNTTLRKQNFEDTFFQMLRLHHEIVSSINIQGTIGYVGRDSFRYLYERLRDEYHRRIPGFKGGIVTERREEGIEFVNDISETFFRDYQSHIGHYFRNLYNIIKFVDKSDINDKKFYTNLVRAQLSSNELRLLFYNCLSIYGNEKFKPLIEKYALLKNMEDDPSMTVNHRRFYVNSAFSSAP